MWMILDVGARQFALLPSTTSKSVMIAGGQMRLGEFISVYKFKKIPLK